MIDLVIGLSLAIVVYLLGVWNGRTVERRKAPISPFLRASFENELKEHLAARDARVISNDHYRYMQSGIYETPYAPRGHLVFVNPHDIARLVREAGPMLFDPRRTRPSQEWGTRTPGGPHPFLSATCSHEWRSPKGDVSHVFSGSPHRCTQSVVLHGPKCVCRCDATVAYKRQPDSTISETHGHVEEGDDEAWRTAAKDRGVPECGYDWAVKDRTCPVHANGLGVVEHRCLSPQGHLDEDDFPHHCNCGATLTPKVDTSDLADRLAEWSPGQHPEGCPARLTPTGTCTCEGEGP